ncbi:MAG: hypothetical protein AB7D57_02620 [Desulfovibrionaceae bacterium]
MTQVQHGTVGGLPVLTGDLIFTTNGSAAPGPGQFWWLVGLLIPGEVDHVAVYVGPGGRCVEAGALGKVVAFEAPAEGWDAEAMLPRRGFVDRLHGVGSPLAGRNLAPDRETDIRLAVAHFCLEHARRATPYNLNFFDSATRDAFYCSQLAYAAYLPHGIDLNIGFRLDVLPLTQRIVFPQEVWEACQDRRTA